MTASQLEPFPANCNPFQHDTYNMGTNIGTNLCVMYNRHPTQRAEYLIVVNKETGERLRIDV